MVWLFPVEFTACSIDSYWCFTAYWLTESAGKYGTLIIIFTAALILSAQMKTVKNKIKVFARVFLVFVVLLASFAFVNENVTKKILHLPRPSHIYIAQAAGVKLDSLYAFETSKRQAFLRQMISSTPELYENLDKRVQEHWIEEAGYSFPSGHSFNAFLCGSLLAWCIFQGRYRKLFFLPLLWSVSIAVSRVAIGAHSQLDVSVGSAMGITVAALFLYFDRSRKLLETRIQH